MDLPEAEGIAVLDRAVAGAEFQLDHSKTIGQAWATGDLRTLRENLGPSASMASLLKAAGAARKTGDRAETDLVSAVEDALNLPGSSVMVLDLKEFAQRGGVIDKLKERGVLVTEPVVPSS